MASVRDHGVTEGGDVFVRAAGMVIRVSDPRATRDLTRFFRERKYLAVERETGVVEVVPIASAGDRGDRGDRVRILQDLAAWRERNRGVEATPVDA
jgi:hypothetical protein